MVAHRQQLLERPHDPDLGEGWRRVVPAERHDLHPERKRAARHGAADAADPDQAERLAGEAAELGGVPAGRRLAQPDVGQVLLEREHRREHELGDGDRAGAARAGQDGRGEGLVRERVEARAVVVHPVHMAGQLGRRRRTRSGEQRVAA